MASNIRWYRVPIEKELLRELTSRSDLLGLLQAGGHLALLVATGTGVCYGWYHWPWWVVALLLAAHGTMFAFLLNGFHELVHYTVFRTKWLNGLFLRLFSFLSWYSHVAFYASHMRHHQYTLHPPDDGEVVLPYRITLKMALQQSFVDVMGLYYALKATIVNALGGFNNEWEARIFPPEDAAGRRELRTWAWITLGGHALIVAVACYYRFWPLILVTTLGRFYGGWLLFLCNNTQHVGLQDKVPDFRLSCRTIYLNPLVRFLYWHMNYHTEHHMYAAVPCYRLGRLHATIRHAMPPCPNGLLAAWREIIPILRRQQTDPTYQYVAPLPPGTQAPAVDSPADLTPAKV